MKTEKYLSKTDVAIIVFSITSWATYNILSAENKQAKLISSVVVALIFVLIFWVLSIPATKEFPVESNTSDAKK